MPAPTEQTKSNRKQVPILARHAVSLSIAFVLGLVLSYFVGRYIHQQIQINKLTSNDQATFERGVGYVLTHCGGSDAVTRDALEAVKAIAPPRAADLLLAVAHSHANHDKPTDPPIPEIVTSEIGPLMHRLDPTQSIGFYDGLIQIEGINPINTAELMLAALNPETDEDLLQVVDLLDTRLLWSKDWAPRDLWVRWLSLIAQSGVELTQFTCVKQLGDLPESADDPRVVAALERLAQSDHERVRAAALNVVAGYAATADDPTDYEQVIFDLGRDANKYIARRAWMVVGHLDPLSGFAVDWQDADPIVAEAMLWAAVRTNPENPKPALAAILDHSASSMGMLALSQTNALTWDDIAYSHHSEDEPDYSHVIHQSSVESKSDALAIWRAWLALEPFAGDPEPWMVELIASFYLTVESLTLQDEPIVRMLKGLVTSYALALTYRLNEPYETETREQTQSEKDASMLAAIEGQFLAPFPQDITPYEPKSIFPSLIAASYGQFTTTPDRLIAYLPLDDSFLLDLFTLALTHADEDALDRFIRSSHPQMMTMAALASVMIGHEPKLVSGVTADFLHNHPELTNDQFRTMTDEELANLGLSRVDVLPLLFEAAQAAPPSANRSVEAKLIELALWMRGDLGDDFTPTAESMLFDDDLPTSTVLMALLYKQRPAALDYLFGDLATQRPDLHKLFIQERYWHVFRRFVNTSDLALWLWGDPEAQAFQLEAMQQWYAVNRWKIEQGWWPAPGMSADPTALP